MGSIEIFWNLTKIFNYLGNKADETQLASNFTLRHGYDHTNHNSYGPLLSSLYNSRHDLFHFCFLPPLTSGHKERQWVVVVEILM